MHSLCFKYDCPQCGATIPVTFFPATPDVYYLPNGDPGYPGSPAEVEFDEECPKCLFAFDYDKVLTWACEQACEARETAEEERSDNRRDEGYLPDEEP